MGKKKKSSSGGKSGKGKSSEIEFPATVLEIMQYVYTSGQCVSLADDDQAGGTGDINLVQNDWCSMAGGTGIRIDHDGAGGYAYQDFCCPTTGYFPSTLAEALAAGYKADCPPGDNAMMPNAFVIFGTPPVSYCKEWP